jgi:hypothetical protein
MDPKKFMTPIVKMVKNLLVDFVFDDDQTKDQEERKAFLASLRKKLVDMLIAHEEALRKEIKEEDKKKLAERRHVKALKDQTKPSKSGDVPKKPVAPGALFANKIRPAIVREARAATKNAEEQAARIKKAMDEAMAEYKKTDEYKEATLKYKEQLTEYRGSSVLSSTISGYNSKFGHVITAHLIPEWYRLLNKAGSGAGPKPKVLNKPGAPERVVDEEHRLIGTPADIAEFIKEASGFDFASLLEGGENFQGDKKNIPAWWTHVPKGSNLKAAAAAATAAFAPKSAAAAPASAPEASKTRKVKAPKVKKPEPPAPAPAAPKTRSKAKEPEPAAPPAPAAAAEESDGDDEYESANEGADPADDDGGDSDIEEEADDA